MRDISGYIFLVSLIMMLLSSMVALVNIVIMSRNSCELAVKDKELYSQYEKRVKIITNISLFFMVVMGLSILDSLFVYGH